MIEDYERGDIYHALAVMCGLTDDPTSNDGSANTATRVIG